jgi:hypothetical protein
MEKSASIKEIASALVLFHKEVGKVKKEATNPFFKSKYASLPNILDAIEDPLGNSGLSYAQFPSGEHELTTILMHISGEWMQASYKMQPTKNDPQGLGSAITYQRRYALGAVLGLNIDEDDDGNKSSAPVKQKKDISKELVQVDECETVTQLKALWNASVQIQKEPEFIAAISAKKSKIKSLITA